MEKKHIDKIAAVLAPDRREGARTPRGVSPLSLPSPGDITDASHSLPTLGDNTDASHSLPTLGDNTDASHSLLPHSSSTLTARSVIYRHTDSLVSPDFLERNRILEEDYKLVPVTTPAEYFKVLFSRPGKNGKNVNFMQATGKEHWGDHHYNAVAYNLIPVQVFDKKTGELIWKDRAEKFDITRDLYECFQLRGPKIVKVISSPILYAGRSRTQKRARSIWGIAIDLDNVIPANLQTLIRYIEKFGQIPKPSMIVSSGGGLHLYYLFPKGVGTQTSTVRALQRLKHNMTKNLWNGLFSSNPDPDLHQGIWQGFRIPGTPTKLPGHMVVGFVPEEIPYYTARELNEWFQPVLSELIERDNKPLTEAELDAIDNNKYLPSEISFQEAQLKWPNWKPNASAGQWYCHRKLYDWWLNKVIRGGLAYQKDFKGTIPLAAGRRFYWIQSLVAFAKKCGIPYEEVRSDAYSLLPQFDSLTTDERNHFTALDVENALKLFRKKGKESVARFTRNYIGAKTHYQFKKTKRNGRTREENLIIARTARDVNDRKYQRKWDAHNGRKDAKLQVQMWCLDHPYNCCKSACAKELDISSHTVAKWWWHENPRTIPEAVLLWRQNHPGVENKSMCARDCGITRPSVLKWWNCTAEDANNELERLKAIQRAGVAAVNAKKAVHGFEPTEEQSSELHDLGAAYNAPYVTDRKVAEATMQHTDGYQEQTAETIRETRDNLTDAINFEALNIEDFMKSMGVPEFLIPMMKDEFQKQMQTPEFWQKYKKAHPAVDVSNWPSQAQDTYTAAIKEHDKKK